MIDRLVLKSNYKGKLAVDQCMKKYTFYTVCAEKFKFLLDVLNSFKMTKKRMDNVKRMKD